MAPKHGQPDKTAKAAGSKPAVTPESHPFIDRHGHRHRASVLRNWSERAIEVLGVRRVTEADLAPKPAGPAGRPS